MNWAKTWLITCNDRTSNEMSSGVHKAQLVFTGVYATRGVYTAEARWVMLYGSKTWKLRGEYMDITVFVVLCSELTRKSRDAVRYSFTLACVDRQARGTATTCGREIQAFSEGD